MYCNRTLLSVGLAVSLAGAASALDGDVGLDVDDGPTEVECTKCPDDDDSGYKVCYEVTLTAGAENDGICDFHVQTGPHLAVDFPPECQSIQELVGASSSVGEWTCGYVDQMEGNVSRHYWSCYHDNGSDDCDDENERLDKGERWEFCMVYCGDADQFDDSLEYVLTNDGDDKPGVPSEGNRDDVPDSGDDDDPSWAGTRNDLTGMVLVGLEIPAVGALGLAGIGGTLGLSGSWWLVRRARRGSRPDARQDGAEGRRVP